MRQKTAKQTAPKPSPARKSTPVSISIQPEQLARLDALATKSGINRSAAVKLAISRLLRDGI